MKNAEVFVRQALILSKLRYGRIVQPEELQSYVIEKMNERGFLLDEYSKRTMQRDIGDVEQFYYVEVAYKKGAGYCIVIDNESKGLLDKAESLLLNFDLLNAINPDNGIGQFVVAEHHRPIGCDNLARLIAAVRRQCVVEFDYCFVRHDDTMKHYIAEPQLLKESQQRWYLLAKVAGELKIFGVERISNLVLTNEKAERDETIDVDALFRDSYGIWVQEDIPVEDIELSYDALDGKFLKSLPLHHSQRVLVDTPDEFRISVRLRITNDFVMELLSRSRSLTVISPQHLRERVRSVYEEALKRNS